ncbi:MAG: YlxR family protein [Myxococcota bacterium]
MRACAACRQRRPAAELLRFAAEGQRVVPDLRRRRPGRGVHVCPTKHCLERAVQRRAFRRVLRRPVRVDLDGLVESLRASAWEGLEALLRDGRRSGDVVDATGREVAPPELKSLASRRAREGRPDSGLEVVVRGPALRARVSRLAGLLDRLQSTGRVL